LVALDVVDQRSDFGRATSIMVLSQTYYLEVEVDPVQAMAPTTTQKGHCHIVTLPLGRGVWGTSVAPGLHCYVMAQESQCMRLCLRWELGWCGLGAGVGVFSFGCRTLALCQHDRARHRR
jgi:hypothetical protein